MSAKNSNIINWENVLAHSKTFQDQKPTKWAFIEEFLVRDFYEKLYETYPKKDDVWILRSSADKSSHVKLWGTETVSDPISTDVEDTNFSESWNQFHHYLFSFKMWIRIFNIQKIVSNVCVVTLISFRI